MFATLLGGLPRPDEVGSGDAALAIVLEAQARAGLAPLTDGRLGQPSPGAPPGQNASGDSDRVVRRWRVAQAAAGDAPVKQTLTGPWSLALERGSARPAAAARELGTQLRETVAALAAAGCPLIEIEETSAHRIGPDADSRAAFRDAHLALANGVAGTHLSLSIVGGSAWDAGAATILDPPYHSLALDLVDGPDNWRLAAELPADRGLIVGALATKPGMPDGLDVLLYALGYGASTNGRGAARVGLGTAGGLGHLSWARALERMERLGEAVRVAALPPDERAVALDPRAVSARSAALGRVEPPRARRARRSAS